MDDWIKMRRKYLQRRVTRKAELINKCRIHIGVHFCQNNLELKDTIHSSSLYQVTHAYIWFFCENIGYFLKGRSELLAMTTPRSKKLDHHSFALLEYDIIERFRCKSNNM